MRSRAAALAVALCLAAAPAAAVDDNGGGAPRDLAPQPSVTAPLAAAGLITGATRAGPRLVAVGQWGHILLSDDDGGRWNQVPGPVNVTLTAVHFADARHGIAVGHDAAMLRTEDGGQSWTLVHFDPEGDTPLLDVIALGERRWLAIGAYGLVMTSDDDGRHWSRRDMGDLDWHLNGMARGVDGRIWIAGEAGHVYAADRALEHFADFETGYAGSFWNVLCLADGSVLAFGMRGTIRRSTDNGATWQAVANESTASLQSGLVLRDGRIVLVGQQGVILISRDGGRHFKRTVRPDRAGLTAALQSGDGRLLLFGTHGVSAQALAD